MDRTNAPGHVNHLFVAEDPATNRPPTEITAQDLNAHQEELINIILAAQIAPSSANNAQVLAALQALFLSKGQAGTISQNFSGLLRTLTPVGGALVREWADSVAATTGNIEIGVSYNCAVDPVTGVWAGRDIADICWLEKWADAGGVKEYWYAATAAAGAVPVWNLVAKIDLVNGVAQFDSSAKLATTEFVNKVGLSAAELLTITANTVLTAAAHAGRSILTGGAAANITLTLPLANTVRAGSRIEFVHTGNAAYSATVLRQGADWITNPGAKLSVALGFGDTLVLESDGVSQWFAVGGSLTMASGTTTGVFGASLAASGYQKLPSGLIIQWGTASLTTAPSTITLPIAFPVQAIGVLGFNTNDNPYWPNCFNLTTTQFTAHSNTGSAGLFYIAIGK